MKIDMQTNTPSNYFMLASARSCVLRSRRDLDFHRDSNEFANLFVLKRKKIDGDGIKERVALMKEEQINGGEMMKNQIGSSATGSSITVAVLYKKHEATNSDFVVNFSMLILMIFLCFFSYYFLNIISPHASHPLDVKSLICENINTQTRTPKTYSNSSADLRLIHRRGLRKRKRASQVRAIRRSNSPCHSRKQCRRHHSNRLWHNHSPNTVPEAMNSN